MQAYLKFIKDRFSRLGRLMTDYPLPFLMLLAGAVLFAHIAEDFRGGIRSNDIHTYWQYARNFLNGKGFAGNTLATLQVWDRGFMMKPIGTIGHPVAVALCFLLIRDWILAAVFSSCLCYLLSVPLIFTLARQWFSKAAAVLSCVLFIFSHKAVLFTLFGGSDPLFTLLLLAAVLIFFNAHGKREHIIGGLVLGLASITRPVGPMYLPPMLGFVWLANVDVPRTRRFGLMLAVMLCCWGMGKLVPIANVHLFGNSALYATSGGTSKSGAMLTHSPVYPAYTAKRLLEMPDAPLKMIVTSPYVRKGFIKKIISNMRGIIPDAVKHLNGTWRLGLLFLLGFLVPTGGDQRRYALKVWMAGCLCFQLTILCVSLYAERYLYPMMPFALMLAAAACVQIAGRLNARVPKLGRATIYAAMLSYLLLPLPVGGSVIHDPRLAVPEKPDRIVDDYRRFGRFLNSVIPAGEDLFTDGGPWLADVYGGGSRVVAAYPYTIEMAMRLHREKLPFDNFVITSMYGGRSDPNEWSWLYRNPQKFLGFTPYVYDQDGLRAVIYKRDSRLEAARLLRQAKSEDADIGEKLILLGRALVMNPKNNKARLELARVRNEAADQSRALLEQTKKILSEKRPAAAFETYLAAGALGDVVRPEGARETITQLAANGLLKKFCYTHNAQLKPDITLDSFPCADVLTDGRYNSLGYNNYLGGSADIVVDFGVVRQTDTINVQSFNRKKHYQLKEINVFSSTDGANWNPVCRIPAHESEPDGNTNFIIGNLGVFARFLKIKAVANGFLPVNIEELEIRGWAANANAIPEHDTNKQWPYDETINVTKMHRLTGRVRNGTVNAREGRSNHHVMAFGRYIELSSGQYKIAFRIKTIVPEDAADDIKIFSIDLAKDSGRTVLLKKFFTAGELRNNSGYRDYVLEFHAEDDTLIEPRLFFEGRGEIWLKRLRISGFQNAHTIRIDAADPANRQ